MMQFEVVIGTVERLTHAGVVVEVGLDDLGATLGSFLRASSQCCGSKYGRRRHGPGRMVRRKPSLEWPTLCRAHHRQHTISWRRHDFTGTVWRQHECDGPMGIGGCLPTVNGRVGPAAHTNDHCALGHSRGRELTMVNTIVEQKVTDGSTGGDARCVEHNRGTGRRSPVARLLDLACSAWRWCPSPGPIGARVPGHRRRVRQLS